MNYFELFNLVMLELGFSKLENFSDMSKNEHLRILEALKSANVEACCAFDWEFLYTHATFELPKDENKLIYDGLGKIQNIYVNDTEYKFQRTYFKNGGKLTGTNVWSFDEYGRIVFPASDVDRTIEIFYKSNCFARSANGTPKPNFALKDDKSVLPDTYSKEILVNCACTKMRTSANAKYGIWLTDWQNALKRLAAESCVSAGEMPKICINRAKCRLE